MKKFLKFIFHKEDPVTLRPPRKNVDASTLLGGLLTGLKVFFKTHGFTKHGHTYNKKLTNGLVQVIQFQLGSYDLSPYETPYTKDMYGKFTVNISVYVPEAHAARYSYSPGKSYISEMYCTIRSRLGQLIDNSDTWWSLEHDTPALSKEIHRLLQDYAVPFLDSLSSQEAIIQHWEKHKDRDPLYLQALDIVSLYIAKNDLKAAQKTLQTYYNEQHKEDPFHPHLGYIQEYAKRNGISLES